MNFILKENSQKLIFTLIIIFIYIILFLPQVFVANDSHSVAIAFEVDPGSILIAIESLFENKYNMQASYHSKYYGWTYYSICFIFSLPLKIFSEYIIPLPKPVFFILYKIVFLLIGLLCVIFLRKILFKLTNSKPAIITIYCLLILISPYSNLFYYIHPESTGILFLYLAIYQITKTNTLDIRRFSLVIIYLSLAVLSKQIFLFAAIPIYIYSFFHVINNGLTLRKIFFLKLILTLFLSIVCLVIINPFAIIKINNFIAHQRELVGGFQGSTGMSFFQSAVTWMTMIKDSSTITFIFLIICILVIIFSFNNKFRLQIGNIPVVIAISAILSMIAVFYGNRHSFLLHYISPTFALSIIPVYSIFNLLISYKKRLAMLSIILLVLICLPSFSHDARSLSNVLFSRLDYRNSVSYISYINLEKILVHGDRVSYDHNVAMPNGMEKNGCSYWQGCGEEYIYKFNPNYVVFVETDNSISPVQYNNLIKYIDDNKMKLIQKINIDSGHVNNKILLIYSK